jgi:MSHA biogenesis protein MshK
MADRLTRALGACMAICALAPGARAQMADPTRPPASVSAPETAAGEVAGPVLQSVLIPRRGKPRAVIGGQQVALGGLYGESRLIKLTESEAVLEGPAGIERLMLTPGVVKTHIIKNVTQGAARAPASRPAQNEGRP